MRRTLLIAVLVLLLANMASAETVPVVPHADGFHLDEPTSIAIWELPIPWWDVSNLGRGFAAGKYDGHKTILEAQSLCEAGMSHYRADAKATWRFVGGYTGFAGIKPLVEVWGQLISYPFAPGAGQGEATISYRIVDVTLDSAVVSKTLMDATSPALLGNTIGKREPLEKRIKSAYGWWEYLPMYDGHEYLVEIKVWTSCWTRGIYSARSDFSRRTIDKPSDPLIGMVLVKGLDFWIP